MEVTNNQNDIAMALRDQPYIPLYVQDFSSDEKLRMCSASATGVYIRIMCLMHKSDPYGKVVLKQKDKQRAKQMASGCQDFASGFASILLEFCYSFACKVANHLPYQVPEIYSAIQELVEEGVLVIEGDELIQKRMVADCEISISRSKSGEKGGHKKQENREILANPLANGLANPLANPLANGLAKSYQNPEYENENNSTSIKGIEQDTTDHYIQENSNTPKGGLGGKQKKNNLISSDNPKTEKPKNGKEAPVVKIELTIENPFTEKFLPAWNEWKEYKKLEHRFHYKTPISEKAALKKLFNLSSGNESTAISIIHESIANGWEGLFPPKQQKENNNSPITNQKIKTPNDVRTEWEENAKRFQARINAR